MTQVFFNLEPIYFYERCDKFIYIEPTHQLARKENFFSYKFVYNNNSFFPYNHKNQKSKANNKT